MSLIKLAEFNDKENIQRFINQFWKRDHILTKSDKLFDYMYKNKTTNKYNFLLSIKKDSINGILGFIPANHYYAKIKESSNIIWYSMWQVINIPENNLQGIRLLKHLSNLFPKSNFGTVGANFSTIPIYKSMRYHVGYLRNFVSFNPLIKEFKIAKINKFIIESKKFNLKSYGKVTDITLKFEKYEEEINKTAIETNNYKNFDFLKNRYFEHPFLKYEIWIINFNSINSFIISRRIKYKNSSYVKVVDYIGNRSNLAKFKIDLQLYLMKESEYIDFRAFGLDRELKSSGFIDVTEEKNLVIPYYNDPFIFKNKKIYWSLKFLYKENYIVTGDCDQDRPNRIINN